MSSYQIPSYFTPEQQQAVFDDGTNILVSAAAGCGKTTLMVQRIIRKIIEDKVNITELIVVTFTEAAAAELKQRLEIELCKRLSENDNDFLKHQVELLSDSYIMTFHALCFRILKENNVAFKFEQPLVIGDAIQIKHLKKQAFQTLKKAHLSEKDFIILNDFYSNLVDDYGLFNLFDKTLELCITKGSLESFTATNLATKEVTSIFDLPYFNDIHSETSHLYIDNIITIFQQLTHYDNSAKTEQHLEDSLALFEEIKKALLNHEYGLIQERLNHYSIFRKTKDFTSEFETLRSTIKDELLPNLKKLYLATNDEMLAFIKQNQENVAILLEYIQEYAKNLKALKLKTGILDFNDLEQYTIDLLYTNNTFSPVALKLKNNFNEIMIDEYQDTNLIQEKIVTALASGHNTFMVGDIKQSIYRFRNATSQLFSDKYELYTQAKQGKVIDLSFNFRSKDEVLATTNYIFKSTFSKNIGGIDYDEKNQLYFKNEKLNEITGDFATNLLVNINTTGTKDKNNYFATATMIVTKIKELVSTGVNYNQITILFKNRTKINILQDALEKEEIPIMLHSNSGFYTSYEIKDLINLLKVLVKPSDDVALLGALRSYFFNLSDNNLLELATIKQPSYYQKLKNSTFIAEFELLNDLIMHSQHLNPLDLINYLYEATPYQEFIYNHNNYEQFLINITSFKGIIANNIDYFNSLSYVIAELDHNIAQNFDDSIPAIISSKEDVVNLMTIHKSKGLEFDYVFLFDESSINFSDRDSSLKVLNQQLVLKYFNPQQRVTAALANSAKTTFNPLATLIDFSNKKDILAEEMRVLYVALTRAKLQLYIATNLNQENLEKMSLKVSEETNWLLSEAIIVNYKKMLDPLVYSFIRHRNGIALRGSLQMKASDEVYNYHNHLFNAELFNIEPKVSELLNSSKKNNYPQEIVTPLKITTRFLTPVTPSKHTEKLLDFTIIKSFDTYKQGTKLHKIFEVLSFDSPTIFKDLDKLGAYYSISDINLKGVKNFINNDFFKLIIANDYKKEYSFTQLKGLQLIKGIIDLYVETDDIIYLIDYKSDRLSEAELSEQYQTQLNIYRAAIKKTTTKKITCLLYSTYNSSFIEV